MTIAPLVTKRYFNTNTSETILPSEFVNSSNKKYIEVVNCHIFIDEPKIDDNIEAIIIPKYISLHADFIHDRRDLDSFVMFVNEPVIKRKKYQQLARQNKIKIWFKDKDGNEVKITDKVKFVLVLLLIF